jgi:hypothetical protein
MGVAMTFWVIVHRVFFAASVGVAVGRAMHGDAWGAGINAVFAAWWLTRVALDIAGVDD